MFTPAHLRRISCVVVVVATGFLASCSTESDGGPSSDASDPAMTSDTEPSSTGATETTPVPTETAPPTHAPTAAPTETPTVAPTDAPTTTVADTTTVPSTDAPTPRQPEELLAAFVAPATLGAGYDRLDAAGPPPAASYWDAISDDPTCGLVEPLFNTASPHKLAGTTVQYQSAVPGAIRSIVVLVVDEEGADAVLGGAKQAPDDAARCWQGALRAGTGVTDLTLEFEGKGKLPTLPVDGVWHRQRATSEMLGADATQARVTLYLAPMLVTISVQGGPSDDEVIAIATEVADSMVSAIEMT